LNETPTVLDASALLALLQNEPGADRVASRLANCVMSTFNLSKVVAN
jgi:PIN domain nuclease of toxin-antitoxin system